MKPTPASRMTLDGYQMRANFTAPMKLSPEIRLATFALGVVGEAGEVAELVKKELGHDHETDRDEMAKELGDILWYTAALANLYGWKLSEVAQLNIDKLKARYPEGFDPEKSKNRKENAV